MNKKDLHQACLKHFTEQAKALEAAARKTAAMATDEEHKSRSKYETFSLENSYLARGQAQRVEEMRSALATLRAMKVIDLSPDAPIQLGALVEVTDQTNETDHLWLVPAGGGEEIQFGDKVVQLLTPSSPLAQALMKKRAGESVIFAKRTLSIELVQ